MASVLIYFLLAALLIWLVRSKTLSGTQLSVLLLISILFNSLGIVCGIFYLTRREHS